MRKALSLMIVLLICLVLLGSLGIVKTPTTVALQNGHGPNTPLVKIQGDILTFDWHPNGRWLAISDDDTVYVWDMVSQERLQTFEGDTFGVTSLAWSPDGRLLAALGNRVVVWDTEEGVKLDLLEYPDNEANLGNVDWDPTGEWLLYSRWNYDPSEPFGSIFKILNTQTRVTSNIGPRLETSLHAARWSPNGTMIAIVDNDVVEIVDVSTEQTLVNLADVEDVADVAWSPDSTMFAIAVWHGMDLARGDVEGYNASRAIQIRDAQTGEIVIEIVGRTYHVTTLDWNTNGQLLATGGYDTTVKIWDLESGLLLTELKEHTDAVNTVKWSPDGTMLASVGRDGVLNVWSTSHLLLGS